MQIRVTGNKLLAIYAGAPEKDKDGNVDSYGHLSFDQYDQDQVLNLDALTLV